MDTNKESVPKTTVSYGSVLTGVMFCQLLPMKDEKIKISLTSHPGSRCFPGQVGSGSLLPSST